MSEGYRPEIDGLRAVAVVPVVLFHAGVPGFSGGFVGVDVFFVISGFLITSILAADVAAGRFSVAGFYERRVRRIFPALFVMLAVSCVAAVALLLPWEMADFGRSLAASAAFVSNFFFMGETGYFVAAAETKPLLHTWSLAIEEQFYILFPLYLYAMSRWAPRWLLPVTGAVLAASLALCVASTHPQNDAAFFYTPARVWELLAGSMLALAPLRLPGWLALAGLAMIAGAVFGFDGRTPFPGAAAVLPVAGTVLVLSATWGRVTLAGRVLSLGPMRFFGLISYSLYLWHWPVIVFWRMARVAPPTAVETGLIVVASVAAATLSWWFVERPFRVRALLARRGPILGSGVVALGAAVAVGMGIALSGGLPGRVPAEAMALADMRFDEVGFSQCDSLPGGRPCLIGEGRRSFVVWGDSHAGMLMPAFEAAAASEGVAGVYLGAAGCVPLLGVDQLKWGFQACSAGAERILDEIAARPELGTVVLVSRWAFYAEGRRFGHELGPPVYIRDGETGRVSFAENGRVLGRGLARTVAALEGMGRRVIVVGQVPENEFELAVEVGRARWLGRAVEFAPSREAYEARQAQVRRLLAAEGVEVLELGLCAEARCPVVREGVPLYRDSNHLTATYARELGPLVAPVISGQASLHPPG